MSDTPRTDAACLVGLVSASLAGQLERRLRRAVRWAWKHRHLARVWTTTYEIAYLESKVNRLRRDLAAAVKERDELRAEITTEIAMRKDSDDQATNLRADNDRLRAYADKLAAGLPCLPKDVEVLREANVKLADENVRLKAELSEMKSIQCAQGKVDQQHVDALTGQVMELKAKLATAREALEDIAEDIERDEDDEDGRFTSTSSAILAKVTLATIDGEKEKTE